jgi:hypothetical protein
MPTPARAEGTLSFVTPPGGLVTGPVNLSVSAKPPAGERVTWFGAVLEATDAATPESRAILGTTTPAEADRIEVPWTPERSGTYTFTATVVTCAWDAEAGRCSGEERRASDARTLAVDLPQPTPAPSPSPSVAPSPSPEPSPSPAPAVTASVQGTPSIAPAAPAVPPTPPTLDEWFAPTLTYWAPLPQDAPPPVAEPQASPAKSPATVLAQTTGPPQGPSPAIAVGILVFAAGIAVVRRGGATDVESTRIPQDEAGTEAAGDRG